MSNCSRKTCSIGGTQYMGAHMANTNKKALIDIPKGIQEFALDCVIVLCNQLRMGWLWLDICEANDEIMSKL
jgi:hypothetical protein